MVLRQAWPASSPPAWSHRVGGGAAGLTDAWQVDGHWPRPPGGHGHHLLPRLPRLGPTVQEQERQPVGVTRLHVQQRVGDRDVAVPESIIEGSGHGTHLQQNAGALGREGTSLLVRQPGGWWHDPTRQPEGRNPSRIGNRTEARRPSLVRRAGRPAVVVAGAAHRPLADVLGPRAAGRTTPPASGGALIRPGDSHSVNVQGRRTGRLSHPVRRSVCGR
jgi:hypothetical protein